MRIIDELTQLAINDPDLAIGFLSEPTMWASPEAYATIDNVTKFALDDNDYEEVQIYHRWTAEEIAQQQKSEQQREQQELIDSLPDAVADLSEMVSNNVVDTADLMDAIAELSELVSQLMEG